MLIYSKVRDSNLRGETAKKSILHAKPQVTIVTPSPYSVKRSCNTLQQFLNMKHSNCDCGIGWNILLTNGKQNPDYLV